MAKIAINLLPEEFRAEDLKNAQFYKAQAWGVAIILFMVFLSSLTVALRVIQNQNITQIQTKLARAEEKISGLKNTQASLYILKNRLATINQYLEIPSSNSQLYKIITKLLPPQVLLNSLSVTSSSEVLLLVTTVDGTSIDRLVTNLTTRESNEGKISQVAIENINRGRDGIYRVNLKIKPATE